MRNSNRSLMSAVDSSPTGAEEKFLLAVYEYTIIHNGLYPDDSWLQEKLMFARRSGVGNLKKTLKDKGYIVPRRGRVEFTEKARQYCQSKSHIVNPIQLRIYGKVEASKIYFDYIEAVVEEWRVSEQEADTVNIPSSEPLDNVFALQVVGKSMEHEGVFEGDYIIVKWLRDGEKPRNKEMIVARYLPIEDEIYVQDASNVEAYLVGPVVKFYHEEEKGFMLGWRKDRNASPDEYRIRTNYVDPIGRVVGLYRPIQ